MPGLYYLRLRSPSPKSDFNSYTVVHENSLKKTTQEQVAMTLPLSCSLLVHFSIAYQVNAVCTYTFEQKQGMGGMIISFVKFHYMYFQKYNKKAMYLAKSLNEMKGTKVEGIVISIILAF